MVLNIRSFPFPFSEKPWFEVFESQVFFQIFGRVVIQNNLKKMYTVKTAFAKVARTRSVIFNYTLDQDFHIINFSFSLNSVLVFFFLVS